MRVLGIDPGTRSLGYGCVVQLPGGAVKRLFSGAIRPAASAPLYRRLGVILDELESIIREFKPDVLSLEKSFSGENPKTAISMGEARGVVLSLAARYSLQLEEFTPTSVKKAIVGFGRADKTQMQKMVSRLLGIHSEWETSDEADALGLALCYLFRRKTNGLLLKKGR